MKLKNFIPLLVALAILLPLIFIPGGCANTSTPPSGGPKDTIPPVIKKVSPLPGDTLVSRKTKVVFTFNEYVKIKSAANILLSPPQQKRPTSKVKEKSVVISFDEPLDSNRTYSIDLTGAIVDNNEGNPFPGFTLVFSTGNKIDSMVMTGTVRDCSTLLPVEGVTVMLYKDHADSAIFLHRPDAAVKTDAWGYFVLRNIQDTLYRVYAVKDDNNNYMFNPETEKMAFLDTLFRPTRMVSDTLKDILKYDMKDTLGCLARTNDIELSLFKPRSTKQMIVNKVRVGARTAYITFMSYFAEIQDLWFTGFPRSQVIRQFNPQQDSLEIWINSQKKMPDTLKLNVRYKKTDSLGVLKNTLEEIKLYNSDLIAASKKSSRKDLKHTDTIDVFTVEAKGERVEQYGYEFEFKYPQILFAWDSLKLKVINPKQKESFAQFNVIKDSTNLRKFSVMPKDKFLKGYEYILKVPHRQFRDINGFYNDSLEVKVSLPNDDDLSTLTLNMTNVGGKYIVELLSENRKTNIRTFIIEKDQNLIFPYLKEGKYCIRITEDKNRNGMVDTGDVLAHLQPEKVLFFKLKGDNELLDIPKRSEIEQTINIGAMFK
ncbi:MAG: Ig-like domain-containing protein [Bacteroidales bacterium]|nr:Ig-like domain-containing protein [Bacteroidales bacterium]